MLTSKLFLVAVSAAVVLSAAPVNVAFNAPVTLVSGTLGVLRTGSSWAPANAPAALPSLTDGSFRPEGETWTDNSLWWDSITSVVGAAPVANNVVLRIDLGAAYTITGLILQADDNDTYEILGQEALADPLSSLWMVPQAPVSYGMRTRPDADQVTIFSIAPVSVRYLTVRGGGTSTDFDANITAPYYSVSELQAFTDNAIPEPGTYLLLGAGLAAVAFLRRRV
jgi:hypothetical protein